VKHQALILASGAINPGADTLIFGALQPFVHEVIQTQRIDIAGHTIVAVLISCDPAHIKAIQNELLETLKTSGLDIAIELVSDS
jgi:predicted amino acid-binding ACT domain protein